MVRTDDYKISSYKAKAPEKKKWFGMLIPKLPIVHKNDGTHKTEHYTI